MNDGDKDDDLFLNPKQKDTLTEVEKTYRKIVFQAYSKKYSEDWFSNIPAEVVKTINRGVKTRRKFGEEGLDEPSEKFLDSSNLGELIVCIENRGIWPALSKHFLCNKEELKFHWSQVNLLRASEAHNYAIPDKSTKTTWLASLEHVRRWGEDAFSNILSDQD